jgi:hypothetical protein
MILKYQAELILRYALLPQIKTNFLHDAYNCKMFKCLNVAPKLVNIIFAAKTKRVAVKAGNLK